MIASALFIIALMIVISVIGLRGMESIRLRAETIASNQNIKLDLVVKMRAAARERTVILQRLILLDDPFFRDEEFMRFNRSGSEFADARLAYLDTGLNDREREYLDIQGSLSKRAVQLQNKVADLAAADEMEQARTLLTTKAIPVQDQVLTTLNKLYELNHQLSEDMVREATEAYSNARFWMLTTTLAAISIVILLGIFIYIRSAHLNRERESHLVEIKDANKAKSAFLANMSHEIRTPLTAIIGFAEASLDSDQSMNERLTALRTIVRSGNHLLQIINDILDLSKIEADKLSLEKLEVPLFQLMADIESVARMQIVDKAFTFNINYEYPVPKTITTDPLRLKQILFNLLSNAFKFTDSGHVNINVSCDRNNNLMVFSVIDSGTGISKQQIKNIFKAFNQEDVSTTRKYGGTGLGLSITKLLVEKLGGTIDVQSAKGVGSNFTITVNSDNLSNAEFVNDVSEIPLICHDDSTHSVAMEKRQLEGHILLAEDNADNQKLIAMHLEKMGAIVHIVENGKLAIDEALEREYDLVFMDMQMPIMDGIQAVEVLRQRNYKAPIVALTANAMKEDREKCLNAGCDDFISKPIDRDQLYEITARHLKFAEVHETEHSTPIFSTLSDQDDAYKELINQFASKLPEHIDSLINAYNNKDMTKVRKIIHDLKGLGGGYGFNQLSELASKLTFLLEDNNTRTIPAVLIELEDICKRIYAGLDNVKTVNLRSATN